ncbi:hypothetical protein [Ligilactobacillus equi]|uniref:Uncharacterized protein n=1 Tax=Ligilactobacillus equi DPC 6820 TaxID=1392007 RepID=V7HU62_9LACO|nr:hypothetical protein [Ligilactobacillus equi]ETA73764.1 hypothetical protein LEQ_0067c [Ligilactobacillus equi DPC 6820]
MKTYQKTTTVQAEQFDGSKKMIDKYGIRIFDLVSNPVLKSEEPKFYLPNGVSPELVFDSSEIKIGDWIATDNNGKVWPVSDEDFKNDFHEIKKRRILDKIGSGE